MDSAESARPAPAEQATAEWTDLENSLADYLEGAASTPKHNSLLLEVTGEYDDSGCTPYVEVFTVGGGKEFRIELSGNAHLAPMFQLSTEKLHQLEEDDWQVPAGANPYRTMPSSSASAAAGAVTHLLHHTCGLSDPRLLSYQAAGPSAAGAARLGLRRSDQVPVDVVDTAPPLASYAKDSDELRAMVHAAVRIYLRTSRRWTRTVTSLSGKMGGPSGWGSTTTCLRSSSSPGWRRTCAPGSPRRWNSVC